MKRNLFIILLIVFSTGASSLKAQKIIYNFGEGSDVLDSLKSAITAQMKWNNVTLAEKLPLCIMMGERNGIISMTLGLYPIKSPNGIMELVKSSDRCIAINGNLKVPIIFETDLLSLQIRKEKIEYIDFGGYFIEASKNSEGNWKVSKTAILF